MPRDKSIAAWKRKKSEVETRIKNLEKIRSETVSWLEKASGNRTELWRRNEYLKFLQKQQRLDSVVRDTALKLDAAKQELRDIQKQISKLEQSRVRNLTVSGGILALVMIMLALFSYSAFFSDSSLTGAVVTDTGIGSVYENSSVGSGLEPQAWTTDTCTIITPTSDPSPSPGGQFTFTCETSASGSGGGYNDPEVNARFCSTGPGCTPSTNIPASAAGLTTASTNPQACGNSCKNAAVQFSFTIDANTAGDYTIDCRCVGNNDINSADQDVTVVADTTPPSVTNITPPLNALVNFSSAIEISANVTDSSGISAVNATVLLPNGSITLLTLSTTVLTGKYNTSYDIPNLTGFYNISFGVNDTLNNINSTEFTNMTARVGCAAITKSLTMDRDLTADGTCFTINSHNIKIDCKGYYINYSVNAVGNAVRNIGFNNIEIRNCRMNESNALNPDNIAINISQANNITIINNSINLIASSGVRLREVFNSTIFGNNFTAYSSIAGAGSLNLLSENTNNTNISSNIFQSVEGEAIEMTNAHHNKLISNRIIAKGLGHGIFINRNASNNVLLYNNITTAAAASSNAGIFLSGTQTVNNTVELNMITADQYDGIVLLNNGNASNIIKSNNITTFGAVGDGIALQNSSQNLLENNTIIVTGNNAIGILFATSVTLSQDNYLINNYINTAIFNEITDESTVNNYLIYNNSFGEIRWLGNESINSFLTELDLNVSNDQGIGLGRNLFIGNNVAALNLSLSNFNGSINSSANITLRGLTLPSITNIKFLGTYSTSSEEIQTTGTDCLGTFCTLISYSGGVLVFNTTMMGSFAANFTEAPADALGPNVTNMTPALNSRFNFSTSIEISANVTDSTAVSVVNVSILLPNGSITPLFLSSTVLTGKYNVSYAIPNLTGFYNVSFGANDTLNNINITEFTNFTAANNPPVVYWVAPVHPQSITEGGIAQIINISFNVSDVNGHEDIDNSSAQLRISFAGETDRFNTSCSSGASTSTTIQFNCTVGIWYFDGSGNWTINVSVKDKSSTYAENRSTTFEIYSTTAMTMSPNALTWPTIELGRSNITANNDPIRINNTGNKNIAVGGITIAGSNLQGVTTTTDFIYAGNFSIFPVNFTGSGGPMECNGTQLVNSTSGTPAPQSITVANITRGNNTIDDGTGASGQEELFICLRLLPLQISRQSYDTSGTSTSPWTIAVS